jgi:hypothetical protein
MNRLSVCRNNRPYAPHKPEEMTEFSSELHRVVVSDYDVLRLAVAIIHD